MLVQSDQQNRHTGSGPKESANCDHDKETTSHEDGVSHEIDHASTSGVFPGSASRSTGSPPRCRRQSVANRSLTPGLIQLRTRALNPRSGIGSPWIDGLQPSSDAGEGARRHGAGTIPENSSCGDRCLRLPECPREPDIGVFDAGRPRPLRGEAKQKIVPLAGCDDLPVGRDR